MDYRRSDGRCSFEIEHRANSAKVADMHETRARKLSDVTSINVGLYIVSYFVYCHNYCDMLVTGNII